MTMNRRSRRPKKDDGFWNEYVRSGSFDPATPAYVPPTVEEAERLLEEARLAEAEQAEALALQAEDEQRRRADFDRQSATDLAALEDQLDAELTRAPRAEVSPDRELRVLSRGFLHGFGPRGIKFA